MLNEKEKKEMKTRLKKISGQVNGIDKMIEEGRYCVDVLQQITAARSAMNQVALLILESHTRSCVVNAIKEDRSEEAIEELLEVVRKFTK